MAAPDKHGWDKAARLTAQRRRQIRDRRPPVLEPSFPWRADPFPAEFFGIRALTAGGESAETPLR